MGRLRLLRWCCGKPECQSLDLSPGQHGSDPGLGPLQRLCNCCALCHHSVLQSHLKSRIVVSDTNHVHDKNPGRVHPVSGGWLVMRLNPFALNDKPVELANEPGIPCNSNLQLASTYFLTLSLRHIVPSNTTAAAPASPPIADELVTMGDYICLESHL